MTIMKLAEVFTGRRAASKTTSSKASKQSLSVVTVPGVGPAVIGNCSTTSVEKLPEIEDDQWSDEDEEVDAECHVSWRQCSGCAMLLAPHESKCQVCGAANAFHAESQSAGASEEASSTQSSEQQKKTQPERVCDVASESTNDVSDNDDEEAECDSDSDCDLIPGTLDVAPPSGTQVKVLYDDDKWYHAQVVASSGARARIVFASGQRTTINCEVCAVRLADYTSDDESDVSEDDQTDADESDSEEEIIPGVLEQAPSVGTAVKILYDDERWYPAFIQRHIPSSNGTRAVIVDFEGQEDEVDFEEYAVRLFDHVSEDDREDDRTLERLESAMKKVYLDRKNDSTLSAEVEREKVSIEEAITDGDVDALMLKQIGAL